MNPLSSLRQTVGTGDGPVLHAPAVAQHIPAGTGAPPSSAGDGGTPAFPPVSPPASAMALVLEGALPPAEVDDIPFPGDDAVLIDDLPLPGDGNPAGPSGSAPSGDAPPDAPGRPDMPGALPG